MPNEEVSHSPIRKFHSLKLKTTFYLIIISVLPLLITNLLYILFFNERSMDSLVFLGVLFVANLVMVLLLSWLISSQLLKPLDQLKQISQSVQKGDLKLHIKIDSGDEFEELADSTNKMLTSVQQFSQKTNYEKLVLLGQIHKANAVLSTINDPVVAVDFQRNITLFNKPAEILTGWNATQVIGQPISQVLKVYDKKDELSPLIYCPVGNNDSSVVLFSKDNLRMMGNQKELFVNLVARQIPEGSNINLGCILTFHDITHEKQLEEMKLDFVSMAAHELRTPLTTIKGYLSVFMEENVNKFSGDQQMFLDRIAHSTEQLISLVENLLNVSRVERGTFSIFRQELDWVELVTHIVSELTTKAGEKKIELSYANSGVQHLMIEADKLRVTEVITNLISNAINYTPVGGSVIVWVEANEHDVITHIKDSGVGIPKDAQAHLFTKFYRVANKFGTAVKGTGLGLYISKAIVDLHHGRIWVNSIPGQGSVFSFSLPRPQISKTMAMPVS